MPRAAAPGRAIRAASPRWSCCARTGRWRSRTSPRPCSVTTLVVLRPDGPMEVANFPSLYDDSGAVADGARSIQGKIVEIRKQQGFVVKFEGTRSFAERYVWRGGKYRREGGESQIPTC